MCRKMDEIFKYLPPERIDVLESRKMRLSQPCCLNDPHDALVAIRSRLEEQDGEARVLNDDFYLERQYSNMLREDYSRQLGVLCFSSSKHSVLMWSHYARNHTGFLIHFNTQDSFFDRKLVWKESFGLESEYEGLPHPSPVRYLDIRPTYYIQDGIPWEVLFIKSIHWSYEMEYRSLMNLSDGKMVESTKDDLCPVYLIEFSPSVISGVTLGLAASNENRKRIIECCKNLKVPVYQIRTKHLSFDLKSVLAY